MTKARDIADFKFENIVDTGTEGTKIALGTTAQRGSTTGQIRFNSTTGLAEYYTGTSFKTIDSSPTVSGVGNTNITDAQISSNYDLSITGTNFQSGATVKFIGNDATEYPSPTVTVNSDTSITARVPTTVTNANEPFDVLVSNASGLSNTLVDAFNVDAKPVWSTASGQVGGNIFESIAMTNTTLTATDPEGDTIAYSIQSGALPTGISLNSSTGVLSGTPSASITSDTTSNFTVRATSGTNTTDRAFNIVVKNTNTGHHAGVQTSSMTGGSAWFNSFSSYHGVHKEAQYQFATGDLISQFQTRKDGTGTQVFWMVVYEQSTTTNGYVIIAAWKFSYTNSANNVMTHLASNATATVTHSGITLQSGNRLIIPSGSTASTGTGNYYLGWVSQDDGTGSGSLYSTSSSGGSCDYIQTGTLATNLGLSAAMPDDIASDTVIVMQAIASGDDVQVNASG
jgi:hypothetical protein|tara:strand:- start:125 stop:1489 length:1365 start_codon:yes stop_codon:yes gene_type:complete